MSVSRDQRYKTPVSGNAGNGTARWRHLVTVCCLMALMMSPMMWGQQPRRGIQNRTVTATPSTSKRPTNPQPVQAARKGAKGRKVQRITPQIPKANRNQTNKVFLENADAAIIRC